MRDLVMMHARVLAYTVVLAAIPVLAVGLTILPSLSSLEAETISAVSSLGGLGIAWLIELAYQGRLRLRDGYKEHWGSDD